MNSNFDLNIKNYTTKELEELFELPLNYDESIVEIHETKRFLSNCHFLLGNNRIENGVVENHK